MGMVTKRKKTILTLSTDSESSNSETVFMTVDTDSEYE